MSRLFIKHGTEAVDVLLQELYVKHLTSAIQFKEGDLVKVGTSAIPILREEQLSLGIITNGSNMELVWSFNDTLLNNPVIVIMGSSHSISLNLNFPDRLQDKIQAWFDTNHGGATIHNIGVAGEYTDHWLPTAQGGLADRNIDMALSFNPDIILLIGPTNDVLFNTTAEATANLQIIRDYARQHGSKIFIHSPLPRGDFNPTQVQGLVDNNTAWEEAFPYELIRLMYSSLNNGSNGINPTYYQGDNIHLNATGTTYQATGYPTAVIPTLERELRANTAYINFIVERSDNGSTGWTVFDTITDQQEIRKTYSLQEGYYRVTATLNDNTTLPYSNIVQVVEPVAGVTRIMFSDAAVTPPTDWLNLSGDPADAGTLTITDPATGWTLSSLGNTNWTPLGGNNAQNGWGATTLDSGGTTFQSWPIAVFGNYWYNYNVAWNPGTPVYQLQWSNLDPAKTYILNVVGSRSNANGATGPYSVRYHLEDNLGVTEQIISDTYKAGTGNTSSGATFAGVEPKPDGTVRLALNFDGTGAVGHINAISLEEETVP